MDCGHDFILSVTNNKRCKQINKIFPPTFKESVPVQHQVSASYLYFAQGRDGAREKCRGGVDKKMPTRNCCATPKCEVSK